MSSGVWKQYVSWMITLLKLVGSKQIQSFGLPVLSSVDSTKTKLFTHRVASWTGLMTPAVSILSISCLKVCFKSTGNGSAGCLFVCNGWISMNMIWLTWELAYACEEFWVLFPNLLL